MAMEFARRINANRCARGSIVPFVFVQAGSSKVQDRPAGDRRSQSREIPQKSRIFFSTKGEHHVEMQQ
jgi:hypothetical protein